jgi:phosphopantothenoylcysteine decarboxylase/phosphopantothenate--cysteine ligase
MAKIILGVSGSVAAYKAAGLLRLLLGAGHEVVPLLTPGAKRFLGPDLLPALARSQPSSPYPHLERADLLLVAPASANTLAKLAHGLADNVLLEAALAHIGPLLLAPAMNPRMWEHPATKANVAQLRARGAEFSGPAEGDSGEGEWGVGRMSEPGQILAHTETLLSPPSPLRGLKVLVSAGGTREPLDLVRYLGNRSSGRLGVALAEQARKRGAEVTLLAANLAVPAPWGVTLLEVETAAELRKRALEQEYDILLMAAAVSDYAPKALSGKRPKSNAPWPLELWPTADILLELAQARRPGQLLVGFGADSGEQGLARKRHMLSEKRLDLVVYADLGVPGAGFDSPRLQAVLLTPTGERRLGTLGKTELACLLLDQLESLL